VAASELSAGPAHQAKRRRAPIDRRHDMARRLRHLEHGFQVDSQAPGVGDEQAPEEAVARRAQRWSLSGQDFPSVGTQDHAVFGLGVANAQVPHLEVVALDRESDGWRRFILSIEALVEKLALLAIP